MSASRNTRGKHVQQFVMFQEFAVVTFPRPSVLRKGLLVALGLTCAAKLEPFTCFGNARMAAGRAGSRYPPTARVVFVGRCVATSVAISKCSWKIALLFSGLSGRFHAGGRGSPKFGLFGTSGPGIGPLRCARQTQAQACPTDAQELVAIWACLAQSPQVCHCPQSRGGFFNQTER